MNEQKDVEESFYKAVADALGVTYDYKAYPYAKRTRWNNRTAGNGRYENRGLVRMFGTNCIHVSLHTPRLNAYFNSPEEALAAIVDLLTER